MLKFSAPAAHGQYPPAFLTAPACKKWLRTLPLSNVQLAHTAIVTQLNLLNRFQMPPLERFKIMELLREPVAILQEEQGKRFAAQPLPFEPQVQAVWDGVAGLWRSMIEAYRHCLLACADGDAEMTGQMAQIIQRCLRQTGLLMREYYRAYRGIPPGVWRELHELYAYAEAQRVADLPVKDKQNPSVQASSCQAEYAQAVLTYLANPYQLSPKQFKLVNCWLDQLAVRISLERKAGPGDKADPIAVDLAGAAPPRHDADGMTQPRFLEAGALAATLAKRLHRLRKGDKPDDIGLGGDCVQPACEQLIEHLYRFCCKGRPKRQFQRRQAAPKAELGFGFEAAYRLLSGENPFVPPLPERGAGEAQEPVVEIWEVRDESVLGFGLMRHPGKGVPIWHNRLLALRPFDSKQFVAGVVRWMNFDSDNELFIGVRLFAGIPAPVMIRPWVSGTETQAVLQGALMLPELAPLRQPPTLILPAGFYREGVKLEFYDKNERRHSIALEALLDRGVEYERAAFAYVGEG
ncbi:MAG: hypothetical protein ACYC2R_07275 [Burkholderiales bacterium]